MQIEPTSRSDLVSDLILEPTIPWTFWAGSFLSRFTGAFNRVSDKSGALLFALFA